MSHWGAKLRGISFRSRQEIFGILVLELAPRGCKRCLIGNAYNRDSDHPPIALVGDRGAERDEVRFHV